MTKEGDRQQTAYVVLKGMPVALSDGDGTGTAETNGEVTWLRMEGVVEATNQDAAISKLTKSLPPEEQTGTWKAVAESSWKGGQTLEAEEVVNVKRMPYDD